MNNRFLTFISIITFVTFSNSLDAAQKSRRKNKNKANVQSNIVVNVDEKRANEQTEEEESGYISIEDVYPAYFYELDNKIIKDSEKLIINGLKNQIQTSIIDNKKLIINVYDKIVPLKFLEQGYIAGSDFTRSEHSFLNSFINLKLDDEHIITGTQIIPAIILKATFDYFIKNLMSNESELKVEVGKIPNEIIRNNLITEIEKYNDYNTMNMAKSSTKYNEAYNQFKKIIDIIKRTNSPKLLQTYTKKIILDQLYVYTCIRLMRYTNFRKKNFKILNVINKIDLATRKDILDFISHFNVGISLDIKKICDSQKQIITRIAASRFTWQIIYLYIFNAPIFIPNFCENILNPPKNYVPEGYKERHGLTQTQITKKEEMERIDKRPIENEPYSIHAKLKDRKLTLENLSTLLNEKEFILASELMKLIKEKRPGLLSFENLRIAIKNNDEILAKWIAKNNPQLLSLEILRIAIKDKDEDLANLLIDLNPTLLQEAIKIENEQAANIKSQPKAREAKIEPTLENLRKAIQNDDRTVIQLLFRQNPNLASIENLQLAIKEEDEDLANWITTIKPELAAQIPE